METVEALPAPDGGAIRLGLRIRHARMSKGMKLRDVARKANCSESLMSRIENDKVQPSLSVLHRIAVALDLTVGQLFARSSDPGGFVWRSGERHVVTMDPNRKGSGLTLERLIPYEQGRLLQGNIHNVAPNGGMNGPISHEGEEVGYVIEGQIELTIGSEIFLIECDDSFCFRSELSHSYRNPGPDRARIIFINTPPTF
jgi:mannose-6-phosphate isomerase-like protein (cupin superfamily)